MVIPARGEIHVSGLLNAIFRAAVSSAAVHGIGSWRNPSVILRWTYREAKYSQQGTYAARSQEMFMQALLLQTMIHRRQEEELKRQQYHPAQRT